MFTFTRMVVSTVILSAVGFSATLALMLFDKENPTGAFLKGTYKIAQEGEDFDVKYCLKTLTDAIYSFGTREQGGTYVGIQSNPYFQQVLNTTFNTGRSCAEIQFTIGASEKDYCISAVLPRSQTPVCRDERMRQTEAAANARPNAEYVPNDAHPNKVCGGNARPYCQ